MINAQRVNVDMIPSGVPPVVYMSQYDIGRKIEIAVHYAGEAVDLSAYTVTIEGTRTDGTAITVGVTTEGNVGTFWTTATMSNQKDRYLAQVVIIDGTESRVASIPIVFLVVPASMDENAESIEEDRSLYQQYTATVQALLATERQQRIDADDALQSAINTEASARASAIATETAERQQADSDLGTRITEEVTARQTAVASLQSEINAERVARSDKDTLLQSQIDQLVAPTGEAPSAAEVENARIGIDGVTYDTLGNAIRAQVSDLNDALLKDNCYDISRAFTFGSYEASGVSYVWDEATRTFTVTGTPTSTAFNMLYYNVSALPYGVTPGEKYYLKFESSDENLYIEMNFYDSGGTGLGGRSYHQNSIVTVPDNAYGMMVRVRVASGATLSADTLTFDGLLTTYTNNELLMATLKTFDTVADDLYHTTEIYAGEYVRTLGYYAVGDGGGGLYQVTSTQTSYTISLEHGLYVQPVCDDTLNAGTFGAIGETGDVVSKARKAIAFAGDIGANIIFPEDITISGGIEFGRAFENRTIKFLGNITYTGTLEAITLHNTRTTTVEGCNINAPSGSGIKLLQDGSQNLYDTHVKFKRITADVNCVTLTASTWGIYECTIDVDVMNCRYYCLRGECLDGHPEGDNSVSAFIGQMTYKFIHAKSTENYAIRFDATPAGTTVTGANIEDISFEGSANGIMLRGDCKMVKIRNIRCLEDDSVGYFLNVTGDSRFNEFLFSSPVRVDKIYASVSQPVAVRPITVKGGILSPSDYRFADNALYYANNVIYSLKDSMIRVNGTDFTFAGSSAEYRCYDQIVNNSGHTITYNLGGYFSPFGIAKVYVTQNKGNGSVCVVKVGSATVFDGAAVTEDGESTYMLTSAYNPADGTYVRKAIKVSA